MPCPMRKIFLKVLAYVDTVTGNLEIRPAFINLAERNQLGEGAKEEPHAHIRTF